MKHVLVVKGKGPPFEDIFRNAPLLGNGGEVTFTLIPTREERTPNTFGIQGRIIGILQFVPGSDKATLIIDILIGQCNHEYLIVRYNHNSRDGDGIIYAAHEFHQLPFRDLLPRNE